MRKEPLKKALKSEIQDLEMMVINLEKKLDHANRLYAERARVADNRNKQIKRDRAKIANLEEQIAGYQYQLHQLESTNEMLSDQASDMHEVEVHDQNDAYSLGVENKELKDALAVASDQIDFLQKRADSLENDLVAKSDQLAEYAMTDPEMTQEIADLKSQIKELRELSAKKERYIIKLQDENAEFRNDFTIYGMDLQQKNIELQAENDDLKAWKEQQQLAGRAVNEKLDEYEREHKLAISNAFGIIDQIKNIPWTQRLTSGAFVSAINTIIRKNKNAN